MITKMVKVMKTPTLVMTMTMILIYERIYPFMPDAFSHSYQLNESISNLRVVGWYFSFFIRILKKLL